MHVGDVNREAAVRLGRGEMRTVAVAEKQIALQYEEPSASAVPKPR